MDPFEFALDHEAEDTILRLRLELLMVQADLLQADHDAKILKKEVNNLTAERDMVAELLFAFFKEYMGLEYLEHGEDDVHYAEAYLRVNNYWSSENTMDQSATNDEVPF